MSCLSCLLVAFALSSTPGERADQREKEPGIQDRLKVFDSTDQVTIDKNFQGVEHQMEAMAAKWHVALQETNAAVASQSLSQDAQQESLRQVAQTLEKIQLQMGMEEVQLSNATAASATLNRLADLNVSLANLLAGAPMNDSDYPVRVFDHKDTVSIGANFQGVEHQLEAMAAAWQSALQETNAAIETQRLTQENQHKTLQRLVQTMDKIQLQLGMQEKPSATSSLLAG